MITEGHLRLLGKGIQFAELANELYEAGKDVRSLVDDIVKARESGEVLRYADVLSHIGVAQDEIDQARDA